MTDFAGNQIKSAGPSTPVQITGLSKLPKVGDLLQVVKNDKIARKRAEEVANIRHTDDLSKRKKASLATLKARIAEGKLKHLKVIVKADSNGTLEAVKTEIAKIKTEKSMAKVIHSGVGEITESDIMLASAGESILVGFSVDLPGRIKKMAEREGVEILNYDVIYHLTEKITEILEGQEIDKDAEIIVGELLVKGIFAANKKMAEIGGDVISGLVRGKLKFKIFRKNEEKEEVLIGQAKTDSVQLGQKVVHEVNMGAECGMKVVHDDLVFEVGDRLEFFIGGKK
jgi:translation initiation factor IF-2